MPVAATRQVRQPTRGAGLRQTDRPYPLSGGLRPGRPSRAPDAAARRPGRLLDHTLFRAGQAVYPVDKLVDLVLEEVCLSGGAALAERDKLTNAFRQRAMNVVGLVVLRYRKSTKLRRPDAQVTALQPVTAVDTQVIEAHQPAVENAEKPAKIGVGLNDSRGFRGQ
jgi:hypothetical protein